VGQTRRQIVDQIHSIADWDNELANSLDKVDRDFKQRCEAVEERLQIPEDPETQPNYATKREMEEVLSRNPAMFYGRLQEIGE
jgi:hypothetical protein